MLRLWTDRLRQQTGDNFPEKVTAFRPEMAVHGKFGKPCPVCGAPVQRIVYESNETNYCPRCQTGGKILADRALSRLLKATGRGRWRSWRSEAASTKLSVDRRPIVKDFPCQAGSSR